MTSHDINSDHVEGDPDHWWSYCSCGWNAESQGATGAAAVVADHRQNISARPRPLTEDGRDPACDGRCITAADLGVGGMSPDTIATADLDCSIHGDGIR